jgi:hypothetical protein
MYTLHATPIPIAMWPAQKAPPGVHSQLASALKRSTSATVSTSKQSYRDVVNQLEDIARAEQAGNELRVAVTDALSIEEAAVKSVNALLERKQEQEDEGAIHLCTLSAPFARTSS